MASSRIKREPGRFTRREFLGLGAAGIGALALPGCGRLLGGGGGGEEGISFLHWRGEDVQVFRGIIEKFTEETGISVQQNALPSDAYTGQSRGTLLSGEGSDVFTSFPGSQFVELAEAEVLADLSDAEFKDRFDGQFIEAGTEDFYRTGEAGGRQLAYPYQVVFNIPVYNRGIFEENGLEPPPDWDGFLELCETLKQSGVVPISFAGNTSASQFINPMVMNNQLGVDTWQKVEAGEVQVTEDWYVKTLEQIQELNERGYFQDDVLGSTQEGASALFAQEEAAMLALGSYQMATVEEQNPEIEQDLLAPITVSESEKVWDGIYTSTFMLAVNARSQRQEQAMQFIEFLTRPEIAAEYANGTGQLLSLGDVDYTSEILQVQTPWLEKEVLFQPRYLITREAINQAMLTSVEDILGGMAPEDAAARFQEEIDRTIS
jgi:raffinose/stachyose/melibiose transport system substrate-binding protein